MPWSASGIFARGIKDIMDRTAVWDIDGDSYKAALYNNTGTPDKTVTTAALSSYNGATSQWVVANEVTDVTNWAAGGRALAGVTWVQSSSTMTFDANDTAGGGTLTLTNVYGTLVYDTTVGTQGISFNYFGGANTVTSGTFTIVWNASGIFTITT